MSKLNELFAAPTGDVYLAARIFGISLYTSDKLKVKYINALSKSGRLEPVMGKIQDFVTKGIIVPVYSTNSMFKSIFKMQPVQIKNFAGFLAGNGKIYILVETDSNLFSFTSNDALASVTIHELMHYVASHHLKEFYSIFKGDLEKFYKNYFSNILSCNDEKIKDQQLQQLVEFINFKLEPISEIPNLMLIKYHELLLSTFQDATTLKPEEFNNLTTKYVSFVKILQKLIFSGASTATVNMIMKNKAMIHPLYLSYKKSFNINPLVDRTLCYQEFWSTSEIISVSTISKTPSAKIYTALKKL